MTIADTLTPSQAARAIGCSGETIRAWCNTGRLAYVRTPLGRLVPTEEVARVKRDRDQRREADREAVGVA